MGPVARDDTVEAGEVGAAFGQLFDECFQEFCKFHVFDSGLEDGHGAHRKPFVMPRTLVARLLQEAPVPLGEDLVETSCSDATGQARNLLKESCAADRSGNRAQRDAGVSERPSEDWSPDLLRCFVLLARVYSHLRLTSPNETLEEISTPLLRFFLIPHCLAILTVERPGDMPGRLQRLRDARAYFLAFLQQLDFCGFLLRGESDRLESLFDDTLGETPSKPGPPQDAAARRTQLIEQARAEKELSAKLRALKHQREDGKLWDESTERELYLTLLRFSVGEAFKHLGFIKQHLSSEMSAEYESPYSMQEVPLLQMHLNQQGKGEAAGRTQSQAPPPKMWTCTFRNPMEVRNYLRNRVFQPGHNLPTMSLAECAEIEMEMETKQIGGEKPKVVVEYPTGESRAAAEELKEREERNWDDWKMHPSRAVLQDENPRGSGNKNWNRG